MGQACLGGLASKFGAFQTVVYRGEYAVLLLLIVDAPYREEPCGCVDEHAHRQQDVVHGGTWAPWTWRTSVRNGGSRRDQGRSHQSDADNNSGPSGNRGSRGDENQQVHEHIIHSIQSLVPFLIIVNIPFTNVNISDLPSPTLCVHNTNRLEPHLNVP